MKILVYIPYYQGQPVHKTATEIQTDLETNKPADTQAKKCIDLKKRMQTNIHKDIKGRKIYTRYFGTISKHVLYFIRFLFKIHIFKCRDK